MRPLQSDTRTAYLAILVGNAATFLIAALLLLRPPAPDGPSKLMKDVPAAARRNALTDLPYVVITVLSGVLTLQAGVLEIGLPLWVVRSTQAPRLIVSVAFVLNTVLVGFLQVRASRGTEDPRRAARACLWSGVLLAAACVLYGGTKGLDAVAAVAVLLVAALAHTLGEMLSAAGGWALSYELADPNAPGAYQGVFNSGFAAGVMLAPLVVAETVLRFGMAGWLALGGLFLATGAALVPATRWALARQTA